MGAGLHFATPAQGEGWSPEQRSSNPRTAPVTGPWVDAYNAVSFQVHGSTITDANGDYTLSLEPSFTYKLQFTSPDFRRTIPPA